MEPARRLVWPSCQWRAWFLSGSTFIGWVGVEKGEGI